MREIVEILHPATTSHNFIDQHLRNPDFQIAILSRHDFALRKWLEVPEVGFKIRFRMTVPWADPVSFLLPENTVSVKEHRSIRSGFPCQVFSTFQADIPAGSPALEGTLTRTFHDRNNDCLEKMEIEIRWKGSAFKDQIESEFYEVFKKVVIFEERPGPSVISGSKDSFQDYQMVHDELGELKILSHEFLETVEGSAGGRKPLILPSADQIARIPSIVAVERLSMAEEIRIIREETASAARIVDQIRLMKDRGTRARPIPILMWVTAAGILFSILLGH
jgi:hypothetical protein